MAIYMMRNYPNVYFDNTTAFYPLQKTDTRWFFEWVIWGNLTLETQYSSLSSTYSTWVNNFISLNRTSSPANKCCHLVGTLSKPLTEYTVLCWHKCTTSDFSHSVFSVLWENNSWKEYISLAKHRYLIPGIQISNGSDSYSGANQSFRNAWLFVLTHTSQDVNKLYVYHWQTTPTPAITLSVTWSNVDTEAHWFVIWGNNPWTWYSADGYQLYWDFQIVEWIISLDDIYEYYLSRKDLFS